MKITSKLINLVVACIVLAALAGALYWSNRHPDNAPPARLEKQGPAIVKVDPAAVAALTIKTKNAPPVSLARDADQAWHITAPRPMRADQEQVSFLLSALSPLNAQEVVAKDATDLKQFGLDSPSLEVDFTQKDRPEQRLLIGDNTPVGTGSYAMVAGDARVFTTAADAKTSIDKSLNDLRDKRLITLNADQMSRIELVHDGQTIALAHTAGGWALQRPAPYRTDSVAADSLASALADAQMATTQPAEKAAEAKFAIANPVATVKVTGASGTETLEVRKGNTDDYVKSSVVPGVYRVDLSLGDSLSKSVDDFRNKQLFDLGDAEPDAVDLQITGSKASSTHLVHNPQGWWQNGKKMDADSVEALVSSLRDLTATGFATSGFTRPAIVATVTLNSGKRREIVEIAKVGSAKSGSRYLARRANDPSLYVLDGGAVEGIESTAASLPTAAPGK